jgi:hypothetical protein
MREIERGRPFRLQDGWLGLNHRAPSPTRGEGAPVSTRRTGISGRFRHHEFMFFGIPAIALLIPSARVKIAVCKSRISASCRGDESWRFCR